MPELKITFINIIQIILENIIYTITNSIIILNNLYLWCEKTYYNRLPKYTMIWMKDNLVKYSIKFDTHLDTTIQSIPCRLDNSDYCVIFYKPECVYYTYIKLGLPCNIIPPSITITPCNFHFISVIIKFNTKEVNITSFLFNRTNNYYISDMILFDKAFNNYIKKKFLRAYEQLYIKEIHVIDNMANNIILNENQYIALASNTYSIINKSE